MVHSPYKRFFICGSALTGQPDHHHLGEARLIKPTRTQPHYRLHSVADRHPGIYRTESSGISIPGEVYELTLEQFDALLASEPPDLYLGEVTLDDGEVVPAMLYPQDLIESRNWPDISNYGGWAAYKQSLQQ